MQRSGKPGGCAVLAVARITCPNAAINEIDASVAAHPIPTLPHALKSSAGPRFRKGGSDHDASSYRPGIRANLSSGFRPRKREARHQATFRSLLQVNKSTMGRHDLANDGQPHTCSLACTTIATYKRPQHFLTLHCRNTWTIV